jgi:ketosteroid isomerase-like protein
MSLVEAERAFAQASIEKGTRAAFLEYLAEDSIVFHPGPVNGQKSWRDRPIRPGVLSWQPIFAFVSGSNDLGYTTGPGEFRPKSLADAPVAFGNFVSVWKRHADGSWKVLLGIGSDNPAPKNPPAIKFAEDSHSNKKTRTPLETESERNVLSWAEGEFVKALNSDATAASLMQYLADDVRVFRKNAFPVIGKEASSAVLAARSGTLSIRVAGTEVSLAGDLGYTYGTYEIKDLQSGEKKENGNYLRIWRRQPNGKWKVALDLLNPIPPPTAS